jgi:hypothetical protein
MRCERTLLGALQDAPRTYVSAGSYSTTVQAHTSAGCNSGPSRPDFRRFPQA